MIADLENANTCTICKKVFAGPQTLMIHQRGLHSNSALSVDEKRKRKSEIILQQPEVMLSTGNDSSNSEKSEKKPKITQSPTKKPSNKPGAFSRGGYVKRRRKPKVVVQKTSSTESEVWIF